MRPLAVSAQTQLHPFVRYACRSTDSQKSQKLFEIEVTGVSGSPKSSTGIVVESAFSNFFFFFFIFIFIFCSFFVLLHDEQVVALVVLLMVGATAKQPLEN
jgi:hypothetical protein